MITGSVHALCVNGTVYNLFVHCLFVHCIDWQNKINNIHVFNYWEKIYWDNEREIIWLLYYSMTILSYLSMIMVRETPPCIFSELQLLRTKKLLRSAPSHDATSQDSNFSYTEVFQNEKMHGEVPLTRIINQNIFHFIT